MTKQEQKVIDLVNGFAKANPQTVARLRKAANEIIKLYSDEMTANELEAAKVAFCLGGAWALMTQNFQP